MNRNELLERVSEDIFAYVMNGSFPERELAESIKPEQLDERFAEYELLLDLHFVLKSDVVAFVRDLSTHLRSLRTETRTTSRTRRGTVDGRINWSETIKKRYAEHPRDRSIFVCDNRTVEYDIPENIVLKRLVSIVHTTIREAEEYLRGEYDWVRETWTGNEDLIDELQRIVERNVHIRRIREPDAYEPTERMLTTAAESRHAVYREAASLLRTRERLRRGDADAIRELLDETAIAPDDQDSLFELFVLFRFVATLERLRGSQPEYETIATGRQEVARFDDENSNKEIALYHDNAAGDRDLSFVAMPDADEANPSRTDKVQLEAQDIASDYFDREFRNHTGRPDVIVLEIIDEDDDQHEYLITEVKNSTNVETVRRGIKETLEYLAFLRVNEEYVFGPNPADYFGSGWNGLLVVQDIDDETASLEEQSDNPVTILQASELERNLERILREIL